ncbi:heme-binding protein [Cryobacterium sp. MLB-32]|uniref:GlcG/HbpS family heme-binding protein n=1 Tax=Cryobacterium sp. MLB-32 TaxID=1529318 RepID=UPI00068A5701|nr:heme-binding protein [Cryobacterium sp. MLB-32]
MAAGTVLETITLAEAHRVIDAAVAKAIEIGQPMDIAVVDAGGNLKAHVRMDGANIGSIPIAINKAYTSIAFQCDTHALQEATRPGGPIFGLSDAHGGRLVVFPGGITLVRDGQIMGAIGVSTGTIEQDQEVATAGAGAYSSDSTVLDESLVADPVAA